MGGRFSIDGPKARAGTLTSASWVTSLDLGPGVPLTPFEVPVTASGTSTATSVALSLTVPQFTTRFLVPKNTLQSNLDLTGLTSMFTPIPDVVAMGSFALTGMGGGTLTLVAPSKVSIDGGLAQRRTLSFVTLRLSFVPEPGSLVLLAAAAGGLALVCGRGEH